MSFTIIGLVVDLAGVVMVFFFGIPPKVDPQIYFVTGGIDTSEEIKYKRYKMFSNFGLILLVLGFLLQILGNSIQ